LGIVFFGSGEMSKKDEFIEKAAQLNISRESLEKWREKVDLKAFVIALNEHPDIRTAFREAVEDVKESPEDQAAVGLSQLFGNM